MTQTEVAQDEYEGGAPGAPIPINQLIGVAGLTERDVNLVKEAGYHTVESIAYT